MKIELSYKYSELDNRNEYGLVLEGENYEMYFRWVYFYIGMFLNKKVTLYPFTLKKHKGRLLKSYKFLNDAERQARLIANRIIKIEKL